jgi:hypothetical protein
VIGEPTRRIVASFGIVLVDPISSTKDPSMITSSHLDMAIRQMALHSLKKMMNMLKNNINYI